MRKIVYTCDICGEVRSEKELYHIKIKSDSFIDYVNQEDVFANRKKIDICDICVARFKDFVRKERKKI